MEDKDEEKPTDDGQKRPQVIEDAPQSVGPQKAEGTGAVDTNKDPYTNLYVTSAKVGFLFIPAIK
jgi:hypothetical protein